jgi:hypothetical protein
MQRVRIGLTGLACVFLLVLLGAIFVKFVRDGEAARQSETAIAGSASPSMSDVHDAPKEPLAELGITPGNAPEQGANSTQGAGQVH